MNFKVTSDKNRKIDINWDRVNIYVSRYKPHTAFDVEITKRQPKKSDPLRKYYFAAVMPPFLKEIGYEPDEDLLLHQQLKITYFRIEPDKFGVYRNVPSVFGDKSDVPVPEKKEFVDWVIRKAAAYGAYIEDPGGSA